MERLLRAAEGAQEQKIQSIVVRGDPRHRALPQYGGVCFFLPFFEKIYRRRNSSVQMAVEMVR